MKKLLYTIIISVIGGFVAIFIHNSTYDHSNVMRVTLTKVNWLTFHTINNLKADLIKIQILLLLLKKL